MRRCGRDALAAPRVEAEVMVVAAGGHERGRVADLRLLLEAQPVAVERQALLDVADVQVQVAHAQAGTDLLGEVLAPHGREQVVDVERLGAAGVAEVIGPLLARAVGGELDPVAVGVREVDRLVRLVVGRALDRGPRHAEPHDRAGQLLAARVQQRVVVEAGVAAGRERLRVLVQDDGGLGAVAELGDVGLVAVHAQAERPLVPGDAAVEVADGQVDGAEAESGGQSLHRCLVNQYDARRCRCGVRDPRAHRRRPAGLLGAQPDRLRLIQGGAAGLADGPPRPRDLGRVRRARTPRRQGDGPRPAALVRRPARAGDRPRGRGDRAGAAWHRARAHGADAHAARRARARRGDRDAVPLRAGPVPLARLRGGRRVDVGAVPATAFTAVERPAGRRRCARPRRGTRRRSTRSTARWRGRPRGCSNAQGRSSRGCRRSSASTG